MPKVAFLSPVAESVPPMAFKYAMAAVSAASQKGIEISQIGVTERALVHTARNVLAKGFLTTDCEWAFWFDCDQVIPSNTIPHLLDVATEKKTKFVTGIYYQRNGDHKAVLWKKNPIMADGSEMPIKPKGKDDIKEAYKHYYMIPFADAVKPFRADVCGFGCVLTHREMFEKIGEPWFKMLTGICSEDFYFCVEAQKAGYKLWATPNLRVGHIGLPKVIYREDVLIDQDKVKPIKVEV